MVRTSNGFEIAETDSPPPRPRRIFGTRQSGDLGFHIANPCATELLELARREAFAPRRDNAQQDTMQRLLCQLPPEWQRRYHLPASADEIV